MREQQPTQQPIAKPNDEGAIPYHQAYFGCCNRTVSTRADIAQPKFCPFCGKSISALHAFQCCCHECVKTTDSANASPEGFNLEKAAKHLHDMRKVGEHFFGDCSGPYSDARDCPVHRKDVPPAAPVPQSGGEERDEVAWLIERSKLCLGFFDRKWKWVTFTDQSALRLSRRSDAIRFVETMREQLGLEDVSITEHLWAAPTTDRGAGTREMLVDSDTPCIHCKNGSIRSRLGWHYWGDGSRSACADRADRGDGVALREALQSLRDDVQKFLNEEGDPQNHGTNRVRLRVSLFRANRELALAAAPQPKEAELRELEAKFLAQAVICNQENENKVMKGLEDAARYWEGRSDAFQDAVAFVRAALATRPAQGEKK